MMPRRARTAALALPLLLTVPARAQTVTAHTTVSLPDGSPTAAVPVRAEVHDGTSVIYDAKLTTDDAGQATWNAVPVGSGYQLRIAATYAGVDYYSDTRPVNVPQQLDLPVTVYPVTDDGKPLHLNTLHMIVQVDEPGVFRVLQFLTVTNAGDAAYAGGPELANGRKAGIVIPLPAGATGVRPAPFPNPDDAIDSAAAEFGPERVLDARPVPPSGRQVAITYDLVAQEDDLPVTLTLPYPTQSVSLLLGGAASDGLVVSNTNLQAQEDQQIGQQSYKYWTASSLAPGTKINFTLGPPKAVLGARAWALIGLAAGLLGAVSASFVSTRPRDRARMRTLLVERVAELDADYEAERIGQAEYFTRRGAEIERLMLLQAASKNRGT